jgi:hypothetical protein
MKVITTCTNISENAEEFEAKGLYKAKPSERRL